MATTTEAAPADREIVIRRTFQAPREEVFRAWTDREQVGQWWGPDGFTTTTTEMDPRPGGVWRFVMHAADGTDYPNRVVYREVVEPERLVYSHSDDDPGADPAGAFESTVTLGERGDATELTLRLLFPTAAARETAVREHGAIEGGRETLARLADHLRVQRALKTTVTAQGDREIRIERTFHAPRHRVWRAFTEPDQLARWWGRGNPLDIERFEAATGGRWRFVERTPEGAQGFQGEFREVTPEVRLVQTFEWDGMRGHVIVDTAELEDLGDGRTRVVTTSLFDTTKDRDGMLASNVEQGVSESYRALDRLLAESHGAI